MAHEVWIDEGDPVLERVRGIALDLPDAVEKIAHGRLTFRTTKVFAWFGASVRLDGAWVRHDRGLLVQPDPQERLALLEDPRAFVPAYLGPAGWIGLDLDEDDDWVEVAELVETSYRLTAGVRRVARLDRRRAGPSSP